MMTLSSVQPIFAGRKALIPSTLICSHTMLFSSTRQRRAFGRSSSRLLLGPAGIRNASDVVINDPSGQLGEAVTFNWTTFGFKIASEVADFSPYARLGWYGNGDQLRAYHTWLLIPGFGDSTHVVMEEIGMGEGAQHLALTNPGHMHRGHDLWNISLKFECEA
jgi:hypothetical protein